MDSLITAAARALAAGDPLGALNRVALRNDAPALALRGIAMAQLGDLARARALMRSAGRAFGPREALARARCVIAETEIALVSRDLGWSARTLDSARDVLERHGDRANAAQARYLEARRLVLSGRLDEAEQVLAALDPSPLPAASRAAQELVVAGIAMRRLHANEAGAALSRAAQAARASGIPALVAEVEHAAALLDAPAARLFSRGGQQDLRLVELERLFESDDLVVDTCRRVVRRAQSRVSLDTRPVLLGLARTLAETWPQDASRDLLVQRAFRARKADESYRARLRVEIGRLRALLDGMAQVRATPGGFALQIEGAGAVAVLAPPVEDANADVLAALGDGESWSSSALALVLGVSQRSVQRALDELAAKGRVQAVGGGRTRRWMCPPVPGFPTNLLLTAPLPHS